MSRRPRRGVSRKRPGAPGREVTDSNDDLIDNAPSIIARREVWEGPVPPPAILRDFDELVPGTARDMLERAASETSHRRHIELVANQANIETQRQAMALQIA